MKYTADQFNEADFVPAKLSFNDIADKVGLSDSAKNVAKAIYEQESKSGKIDTSKPNYAGASGPMQITENTFNDWQKKGVISKDLKWDNPGDNLQAGLQLVNHYHNEYKGDPRKVAVAYYGGPGAIDNEGNIKLRYDPANKNAPSTVQYAEDVVKKISSTGKGMKYTADQFNEADFTPPPEQIEEKPKKEPRKITIPADFEKEPGVLQASMISAGGTFNKIGRGLQQLYYGATDNKTGLNRLEQEQQDVNDVLQPLEKEYPVATTIGKALPYALVAPTGVVPGAIAGGITGGLEYGTPEERLTNAVIGTALGGAGGKIGSMGKTNYTTQVANRTAARQANEIAKDTGIELSKGAARGDQNLIKEEVKNVVKGGKQALVYRNMLDQSAAKLDDIINSPNIHPDAKVALEKLKQATIKEDNVGRVTGVNWGEYNKLLAELKKDPYFEIAVGPDNFKLLTGNLNKGLQKVTQATTEPSKWHASPPSRIGQMLNSPAGRWLIGGTGVGAIGTSGYLLRDMFK